MLIHDFRLCEESSLKTESPNESPCIRPKFFSQEYVVPA